MNKSIDIYSRIGTDCPAFYPDFSSGKGCPEISRANCKNCRNFSPGKNKCIVNMFDSVMEGLFENKNTRPGL